MKKILAVMTALTLLSFGFMSCSDDDSSSHEHSYSSEYQKDGTKHWKECECGAKTTETAHTWNGNYISNNDATTESDGTKSRICTVCEYEDKVTDVGSKKPSIYTMTNASGNTLSTADLGVPSAFTVNGKTYYAYNDFIKKTSGSNWQNAMDFMNMLNDNKYGGYDNWMLIEVNDWPRISTIGSAWYEKYISIPKGNMHYLWTTFEIKSSQEAFCFDLYDGVCDISKSKFKNSEEYGFLVLRPAN